MKHVQLFENFEKFDIRDYVKIEPNENWRGTNGISRQDIELNVFHSDIFGELKAGDILIDKESAHIIKLTDPSIFKAAPLQAASGTFSTMSFNQYGLTDYRRLVPKGEYEKAKGKMKGKQFGF